jgi:hypothetical protein
MKNTTRIAMILVALVSTVATAQVSGQSAGGGRLAGAWDTTITIYNCATGAPIRQFASLGIFSEGGTFTGITSGTPPAARSAELGVWKHVKAENYVFRFKAFLFDAAGSPVGYQVVTHEIALDTENLNYLSDGGVQIFNMAGTQIGSGCSSAVGTRMAIE